MTSQHVAGENNVVFIRPAFDLVTEILNTKISPEVVQYASKRLYMVDDLYGERANKTELLSVFIRRIPIMVFAYSHGDEYSVIGPEVGQTVFDVGTAIWFNQKIVVINACLTGVRLAPALIDNGARAVLAYDDELILRVWSKNLEPLKGFKECLNKPKILFDGASVNEAHQQTLAEYEKWIEYWDEIDPTTADILRHNRDHFKLYGNGESRIALSTWLFMGMTDIFAITWVVLATILKIVRLTKPLWKGYK